MFNNALGCWTKRTFRIVFGQERSDVGTFRFCARHNDELKNASGTMYKCLHVIHSYDVTCQQMVFVDTNTFDCVNNGRVHGRKIVKKHKTGNANDPKIFVISRRIGVRATPVTNG